MKPKRSSPSHPLVGFLGRLRRDARGNALAIMAAMLIPLAAFSGSAIDMGRLYTVKSRLQQACDAGALAGRKFMADSSATTLDNNATAQAQAFFTNNFRSGWFKVASVTFTPTKTVDNQVAGTASATVPMTIMTMFGIGPKTVSVSCQARYDVADTDIIFVLDTTGSMACLPADSDATCTSYVNSQVNNNTIVKYSRPADSALGAPSGSVNSSVAGYPGSMGFYVPEKTGSRIAALRAAVINFYNTLAPPNVDASTHIRYGFVTYSSTVNAGRAIMDMSPSYMVGGSGNTLKKWTYQSRQVTADYTISSNVQGTVNNTNSLFCSLYNVARNPATPLTYNTSSGQATETKAVFTPTSGLFGTCTVTSYVYGPVWTYQPVSLNVSSFLTSAAVDDPTQIDSDTAQWQGCIEERDTNPGVTSFDISNLPPDLDPDLIPDPTSTTGRSSWRPMWPEVIYGRNYNGGTYFYGGTGTTTSNGDTTNIATALSYFTYSQNGTSNYFLRSGMTVCGKPVRRLATMSLQDVTNYVNATDFRPIGGTYHDVGMIWGVRMLSRNGIFASDNSTWPGRLPPNRVIVFLTDGDMSPSPSVYGLYGIEYFDKRVTGGDYANQTAYHNARFLAECAKAKSMNISVWTVSIAPSATSQMQQCATTTSQALYTTDGTGLSNYFTAIAKQVAMLRISK